MLHIGLLFVWTPASHVCASTEEAEQRVSRAGRTTGSSKQQGKLLGPAFSLGDRWDRV